MNKIILTFLTILTFLFVGCGENNSTQTNEKKVIKVGTSGGYFPFTFYENDQLKGFEIDVWNAIGEN